MFKGLYHLKTRTSNTQKINTRLYASNRCKAISRHETQLKKEYDQMRTTENNVKIKIDPTTAKRFEVSL